MPEGTVNFSTVHGSCLSTLIQYTGTANFGSDDCWLGIVWTGIHTSHFLNFCNIYYDKSTQVFHLYVKR